jgi:hypothetical protein
MPFDPVEGLIESHPENVRLAASVSAIEEMRMAERAPVRSPGSLHRWLVPLALLVVVTGSPALEAGGFDDDEEVRLEGSMESDRFVAGAEIGIDSVVARDLFAAGGEILADGLVADDVTMAAGALRLRGLDG